MPKQKTHKGLTKRVKITARGKLKRKSSFSGHLMSHKSGRRKQRLRKDRLIVGQTAENCKRAMT